MAKRWWLPCAAALLLPTLSTSTQTLCEGFLPENDWKIPITKSSKGMTEAQFNEVLDRVEAIYGPIVSQMGGNLQIKRLWTNDTVNASAQRWGNSWILNMYGGLARHEAITQDGFALVACHEMGHHLGGAPKIGSRWASNEGQSDYFANLKCLRKVFADSGASGFSRPAAADAFAKKMCGERFKTASGRALCERGAAAGMSVSVLFKELRREDKAPQFNTPDPKIVAETQDAHPATQCRTDTYFSGSLCPKSEFDDVDQGDAAVGACTRGDGFAWETRPRCWYKPPNSAEGVDLIRKDIDDAPVKLPSVFKKENSAFSALRRWADSTR